MAHPPVNGMNRIERVLLSCLLRLYPKPFRADFREQWLAFLSEQRKEKRYRTLGLGTILFWMDVLKDLAVSLAGIRGEAARARRRSPRGPKGPNTVESLVQDLRFALRTLIRRPLFSGVAILTLGLGIGAATAMFSLVDGVLLSDRQYRDPDRLLSIWQGLEGRNGYTAAGETRLQFTQYEALQKGATTFQSVAVYAGGWGESTLTGGPRPERVKVGAATASLLPVLGVTPVLGRWFLPEEEGPEAGAKAMIAVMSYDNWVRRYAGDQAVLGRTVILNDRSYTVVGVLPRGFRIQWLSASLVRADDPGPRDFWVPVGSPGWEPAYGSSMWEAVGRLREGVTLEQARTETSVILAGAWEWGKSHAILIPRVEDETRGIGSPLILLFGATGLLLLIACGNVAALSLGEMHGRAHEVATRAAIGADRWRIARQLLTESLVLGVAGSALGVMVAVVGTGTLVAMAPPVPRIDMVRVDLTVLGFAAFLGTLSGVLFGIAPAVLTARKALGSTLRSGDRSGSWRKAGLGRWVLAGEVGLTVMLVVASGLLARSLSELFDMGLGFDPENVASLEVTPPVNRYEGTNELTALMDQVLPALEGIPGVTAVSAANALPFPGNTSGWGARLHQEDSTYLMPNGYHVSPGYLTFMGIPILEGRGLLASDDPDAPAVAVVGQSLAKALWGEGSPVGKEMFYPRGTVTVVGVAADVRQGTLQDAPPLTFYVPFAQHPRWTISFVVRTAAPGLDVLPAMREALWGVDDDLAITRSGLLEDAIGHSAAEERYRTFLMSVFAALATVLAVVGIMGVTARQVAHRTREIGIRKALGAENASLLGGVVGDAATVGAWGIGLGLLGAFWMGPILASFLFGVESFDLPTYAGVAVLFMGVSVLASYFPARRILRVDPVTVLREE